MSRLLTMPWPRSREESLRQQGNGELSLHPRRRLEAADNALLHYMAGGRSRSRIYQYEDLHKRPQGVVRFMLPLFPIGNGENGGAEEADALARFEPARATGVATKISRERVCAHRGDIGTGYQARTTARKAVAAGAVSSECARLGEIRAGALNSAARWRANRR